MTKYKDVLKVEFKDALKHFDRTRNSYHMYRINRLMTNGTLINFDFYFLPSNNPDVVLQEINLKSFGKLTFEIDIKSSYGSIINNNYSEIINDFLENYPTESEYLRKN